MKAQQFIKDHGLEKAREVVEGAPLGSVSFSNEDDEIVYFKDDAYFDNDYDDWFEIYFMMPELASFSDLKRLVESVDRFSEFTNKQEALDAIDDAPEGATDYRKLSCGTRYIKQGPRFFEYWNGSEWCRPTVPFTEETHILRFDKLEDLKQSIKDHESIYGGGDE